MSRSAWTKCFAGIGRGNDRVGVIPHVRKDRVKLRRPRQASRSPRCLRFLHGSSRRRPTWGQAQKGDRDQPSMSLPEEAWLERPWPRRSCATARKPFCARNPSVGAQRPAVREHYDRAFAPVLGVDLGTIVGSDCAHGLGSFPMVGLGSRIGSGRERVRSMGYLQSLSPRMGLLVPSRSCPPRIRREAWPASSRWHWR